MSRLVISKYVIRYFIVLLLLILAGSVIAQDMMYSEAPMLTELVEAGELPPVEDRLPENPLVVTPLEIGQYGGTWRRAKGPADWANLPAYRCL